MNDIALKKLMEDDVAREELRKSESPEALAEALKSYGVDCSAEEIRSAMDTLINSDGELSAENLDNVAGGFWGAVAGIAILLWLGIGYIQGGIDGTKSCWNK